MKIYEVWHADPPQFSFYLNDKEKNVTRIRSEFPNGYQHIADVRADDLNEVFHLTNTVEELWTRNVEIAEVYGDQFRSTSVGDVIIDGKQRWLVDGIGWIDIST